MQNHSTKSVSSAGEASLQTILQALRQLLGPANWSVYKASVIDILGNSKNVQDSLNRIYHIVHSKPAAVLMHNDIALYTMEYDGYDLPRYSILKFNRTDEIDKYLDKFMVLDLGNGSQKWRAKVVNWMKAEDEEVGGGKMGEKNKQADELINLLERIRLI